MSRDPACDLVEEALSARLDGEQAQLSEPELTRHLADCPGCRAFEQQLHDLTRRARVRSLAPERDLTARVVAARADNPLGLPGGAWPIERLLLLVLGLVQLLLSVPPLFGSDVAASLHVSREVGVTDVALAVGLLAAVWQPWRAAGMLPVVVTLGAGLACVALVDIVAGRVSAVGELPHLLAPVSAFLLWRVRRRTPAPGGEAQFPAGLRSVQEPDERRSA